MKDRETYERAGGLLTPLAICHAHLFTGLFYLVRQKHARGVELNLNVVKDVLHRDHVRHRGSCPSGNDMAANFAVLNHPSP